MLQIQNLTIIQKKDDRVLVEDLAFVINDGEKAALIGEEGNGKSTILKWIAKASDISEYAQISGSINCDNIIGYLPQELGPSDAALSVEQFLENSCGISMQNPKEISILLKKMGIDSSLIHETRRMDTLSGGERIKLQMLSLLLRGCDLLLLDEPSNDLDLETLEWLERFLNESDHTVLYVSHDETLLEKTADMLIHLEQVRRKTIPRATVARIGYRDYIERRERQMEHQAQVSVFEHDQFRKKKDRYLSIYQSVEHAQNEISRRDPSGGRLLKKKMHTVQSLGKRLDKEKEQLTELPEAEWAILPKFPEGIEVKNGKTVLNLDIPQLEAGGRVLARNVRLNITGPEHVCIIGQNGCGKSTLIKKIVESIGSKKDLSIGYLPQNYNDLLDPDMTPIEILAPNGDKESVTNARIYLGSMKYTSDEMEHSATELSGGQRAKILLLKLILDGNNVLILDEPTRNFSPLSNPALRTLFQNYRGAIIAVSHDRRFLAEVATRTLRLTENGLTEVRIDKDGRVC